MVTFKEVPPAITEAAYARLIAEFANSGQLTGVLLRIPGVSLMVAIDRNGQVIPGSVNGHMPTPELDKLRAVLKDDLAAITRDEIKTSRLKELMAAASLLAKPIFHVDAKGKLGRFWTYMPDGPPAAIAYGALVIADTAGPYRRDLKQCQLERCGRFFFSSDSPAATGRDRARYCTPEHMHEAHKATSAERTRRWRERTAKAAAKHK